MQIGYHENFTIDADFTIYLPLACTDRARVIFGEHKDMDIGVVLYEVMPNGELFHLSYFLGRASYARDMSVRKLLTPGKVESIPFDKTRMASRKLIPPRRDCSLH